MIERCYRNSTTFILIVVLLLSCKNGPAEVVPHKVVFEHAIMKPWFDTHCATCHATGQSNYLNWHYNPQDFEATFEAFYITKIYNRVYVKKDMPKDKKLTEDEIVAFKNWYDTGFAAK